MIVIRNCSISRGLLAILVFISFCHTANAKLPPIRLSTTNQVPACVTPDRLMRFLETRNKRLISRFRNIAQWYRYHGKIWKVRWDYAFYQMAIETNFLTYRAPNGRWGDVNPKQNNFAGIGTIGGGVPGNSFPDVKTGVLAQIQHLVVYSGEKLADPVAPRTRLKQDVILNLSRPIARRRPVTFQDLSGRWAVDRRYGRSIEYVAKLYRKRFCGKQKNNLVRRDPLIKTKPAPITQQRVAARKTTSDLRSKIRPLPNSVQECRVQIASYGGSKTLLIQSIGEDKVQLTALDVYPGFEEQMAKNFANVHAPGGQTIASFNDRDTALSKAYAMCKRLTSSP